MLNMSRLHLRALLPYPTCASHLSRQALLPRPTCASHLKAEAREKNELHATAMRVARPKSASKKGGKEKESKAKLEGKMSFVWRYREDMKIWYKRGKDKDGRTIRGTKPKGGAKTRAAREEQKAEADEIARLETVREEQNAEADEIARLKTVIDWSDI